MSMFLDRWVRFGKDLELLDSPGILPMRISDQAAAIKLAICDDIGERSYDVADVAAILVQMLTRLPEVGWFFLPLTRELSKIVKIFHLSQFPITYLSIYLLGAYMYKRMNTGHTALTNMSLCSLTPFIKEFAYMT